VENGASFQSGFASATWVSIVGANLSQTTRLWQNSDFVNGLLPTSLSGISVTVNGVPAYVEYISPTQVNVLAPDDATVGQVQVQVTTAQGVSNSFMGQKQQFAPGFFTIAGSYVAALHADYSLVAKPGLIPGLTTTAAAPGETVLIWATGFGPTNPPLSCGQVVTTPAVLADSVTFTIGGVAAPVAYAGLVGSGLYQFNVTVPNVPNGDAVVVARIGGVQTQTWVLITIQSSLPASSPSIVTAVSGLSPIARGLAVDPGGNVYYAETNSIKKASQSGAVSVFAGTGTAGFSGDGGPATSAQLNSPQGVAVDQSGNVYIADYSNGRIRRVDVNGTITTFAGNGQYADSGDGGPATNASFREIQTVGVDPGGSVYVVTALTVRRIGQNGLISTVAGESSCLGGGFSGDGGPATSACLYTPDGVAFDGNGNMYIADYGNYRIREVGQNGTITTVAGNGSHGFSGDGGSALQAAIDLPTGIAVGPTGNLLFSSCSTERIRQVSSNGIIATVVGTGVAGFSGDSGPPNAAQLNCPANLALGSDGTLYVLDTGNLRIRRITLPASQ